MPVAIQKELGDPRTVLYQITVDKYHAMIADGLLPEGEPFELLDGALVHKDRSHAGDDPMTVGHEHALVVMRLNKLNGKLQKLGCHLRPQQPLTLEPADEPEPDAAIVRGSVEDYADRHPGPGDVLCVIEVADSSLRRDRTTKLRIYAAAGIAQYIIINLAARVAEVHTQPNADEGKYRHTETRILRQKLVLPAAAGKSVTIPVASLLG